MYWGMMTMMAMTITLVAMRTTLPEGRIQARQSQSFRVENQMPAGMVG
jgi:hypothetical protein